MATATLAGAPARLTTLASRIVTKAAIAALDDEDAQAAALYIEAAALFRQAGDYDRAAETDRLAADCLSVMAEAA